MCTLIKDLTAGASADCEVFYNGHLFTYLIHPQHNPRYSTRKYMPPQPYQHGTAIEHPGIFLSACLRFSLPWIKSHKSTKPSFRKPPDPDSVGTGSWHPRTTVPPAITALYFCPGFLSECLCRRSVQIP